MKNFSRLWFGQFTLLEMSFLGIIAACGLGWYFESRTNKPLPQNDQITIRSFDIYTRDVELNVPLKMIGNPQTFALKDKTGQVLKITRLQQDGQNVVVTVKNVVPVWDVNTMQIARAEIQRGNLSTRSKWIFSQQEICVCR